MRFYNGDKLEVVLKPHDEEIAGMVKTARALMHEKIDRWIFDQLTIEQLERAISQFTDEILRRGALSTKDVEIKRQEKGRLVALQALHESSDREIKLRKEVDRLGKEVEELMKVDYWQDRYNIVKKDLLEATRYLREAKAKFAAGTTNSLVDDFLDRMKRTFGEQA